MFHGQRVSVPAAKHQLPVVGRPGEPTRLGEVQTIHRGAEVAPHAVRGAREHLYCALSGTLRSCRIAADGRRLITAFLFPGDWFWLEEHQGHPAIVEAITEVQLVRVARRHLATARPEGGTAMQDILDVTLTAAQERMITLGQKSARDKLAAFLLCLSDRLAGGGPEVQLAMSRYDIADYLGLRSETVCRTLSQLVAAGMIALPKPQRVRILDREALEAMLA